MNPKDNPADVLAELVRAKAAREGLELVDNFDERVAEWRAYLAEPVEWSKEEMTIQERARECAERMSEFEETRAVLADNIERAIVEDRATRECCKAERADILHIAETERKGSGRPDPDRDFTEGYLAALDFMIHHIRARSTTSPPGT